MILRSRSRTSCSALARQRLARSLPQIARPVLHGAGRSAAQARRSRATSRSCVTRVVSRLISRRAMSTHTARISRRMPSSIPSQVWSKPLRSHRSATMASAMRCAGSGSGVPDDIGSRLYDLADVPARMLHSARCASTCQEEVAIARRRVERRPRPRRNAPGWTIPYARSTTKFHSARRRPGACLRQAVEEKIADAIASTASGPFGPATSRGRRPIDWARAASVHSARGS